ncbi:hypothetical protein [Aquimarina algiphila]|uniref:hypothetical protein n=1 Tax=Aquimarina algiphila TaxID=2047982 RepID=UPI00248F7D2C|nr:hypothetical protein [Aquimarina algiphila]
MKFIVDKNIQMPLTLSKISILMFFISILFLLIAYILLISGYDKISNKIQDLIDGKVKGFTVKETVGWVDNGYKIILFLSVSCFIGGAICLSVFLYGF